ncbi:MULTISPECIES: chloride channel protein [Sorangium]|uniref:Chloride channel protein n=1 Tax=Sorangium cellulosum TaxID=56 RepID=A0A4P2QFK5_SORCE|nr:MULTISPECIES: chloride channel protein [Sorangium]AUX28637.1 chloride channel protein [Sorangium cellulosum]WCQ88032.1 H(+)/Cl(-) exchange transporter ClcA [Sorangium sp. Soce836]
MSSVHAPNAAAGESIPVAPSMSPTLADLRVPAPGAAVDRRVVLVSGLAIAIAGAAFLAAELLTALIAVITNLAFFGRLSAAPASPAEHQAGALVLVIPIAGALVVGLMARYGSQAIRGHGIPEAMEQVLFNQSRIPPRMTLLKPLSAAIAIGTGGPFGAEGPIIATGGALGSLVGQLLRITADERKTLLAAGAAAGMSATFGSPVSAVLLAIELLLFEYRPRSVIPVALATATAAAARLAVGATAPAFEMPAVAPSTGPALAFYVALGAVLGVAAMGATRAIYAIEEAFERLPLHWMWWPAIGAVAIGAVGYVAPRTLGVGYDNIDDILSGRLALTALVSLSVLKFVSWSIALGSGTSGGTLAPLFTIGGGLGAILGLGAAALFPWLGVDARVAALVGMAAIFAGASRALLASVVFAFETTRQPMGLLPLLGGCTAAFLVSSLLMRHSIMTEKLARRGARVMVEYAADHLAQILVRDVASRPAVTLAADDTVESARAFLLSRAEGSRHQGFPVVDRGGELVGVVTQRDLLAEQPSALSIRDLLRRPPAVVFEDSSLREAADHMVAEGVGRLPVVSREAPRKVLGMLTRSDLLDAHRSRIDAGQRRELALAAARRFGDRAAVAGLTADGSAGRS